VIDGEKWVFHSGSVGYQAWVGSVLVIYCSCVGGAFELWHFAIIGSYSGVGVSFRGKEEGAFLHWLAFFFLPGSYCVEMDGHQRLCLYLILTLLSTTVRLGHIFTMHRVEIKGCESWNEVQKRIK
jgi:hypothetical protein